MKVLWVDRILKIQEMMSLLKKLKYQKNVWIVALTIQNFGTGNHTLPSIFNSRNSLSKFRRWCGTFHLCMQEFLRYFLSASFDFFLWPQRKLIWSVKWAVNKRYLCTLGHQFNIEDLQKSYRYWWGQGWTTIKELILKNPKNWNRSELKCPKRN